MKVRALAAVVLAAATVLAQVRGPAPDVRNIYDPEHPGTWTLTADYRVPMPRTMGATPAHTAALSGRIAALAEVIHRTPVLDAPKGVEIRAHARYFPYEAWWNASGSCTNFEPSCTKFPVMAELAVTLFNFFHLSNSNPPKIITHIEDNSDALFYVNILSQAKGASAGNTFPMPDRRPSGLKPIVTAHAAGFPVYKRYVGDNEAYLYFTNGRPLWVAVTREEFITSIVRNREKDVEQQRTDLRKLEQERQNQLAGREQRIRDLRKVLEQTEKDPAKREKLMQDALKMAAITDEGMAKAQVDGRRQVDEMERQLLGRPRQELERMSPSERVSPAWYIEPSDGSSGLAPAGAPNAREVVTLNLNYFDMTRPRSDIQLISVTLNSQNERRTGPNFMTAAVRLDEFLATADWARIASFVEPAR